MTFPSMEQRNQKCLPYERFSTLGLCAPLSSVVVQECCRVARVCNGKFVIGAYAKRRAGFPLNVHYKMREAS
ncbi:hypothetical protein LMIY3S_01994 [Labrys miyagiensis]